jgi:hypothetical protein
MTFWGEGGCVVASLGPSPPFNGPGRLRDPRRRSNEVSRCPSAWSPRGHQAVTPGSIMPTEQLTYAQIAKHLSVSPEAARAIVKRHRLPRSRRNDGKTLAAIDLKEVKGGVDYWITPELKLGTDVIWVSRQWFVGDDANQNPKLADYWVANLHGSYQLTKEVQIYGVINNLFNRKFATFGTFFDPQSTVANAIPNVLFDHRTVTPAQPLSVYVGMRAKL